MRIQKTPMGGADVLILMGRQRLQCLGKLRHKRRGRHLFWAEAEENEEVEE